MIKFLVKIIIFNFPDGRNCEYTQAEGVDPYPSVCQLWHMSHMPNLTYDRFFWISFPSDIRKIGSSLCNGKEQHMHLCTTFTKTKTLGAWKYGPFFTLGVSWKMTTDPDMILLVEIWKMLNFCNIWSQQKSVNQKERTFVTQSWPIWEPLSLLCQESKIAVPFLPSLSLFSLSQ